MSGSPFFYTVRPHAEAFSYRTGDVIGDAAMVFGWHSAQCFQGRAQRGNPMIVKNRVILDLHERGSSDQDRDPWHASTNRRRSNPVGQLVQVWELPQGLVRPLQVRA